VEEYREFSRGKEAGVRRMCAVLGLGGFPQTTDFGWSEGEWREREKSREAEWDTVMGCGW
jgi:hypothetical protein